MSSLRQRKTSIHDPHKNEDFLSTFKKFDAYAKPLEDFRVKTASGATGKVKKGEGARGEGGREGRKEGSPNLNTANYLLNPY